MSIIDILATKEDFLSGEGVEENDILSAEKILGVAFSDSYRYYLRTFGIAAFSGHELTGISRNKRTHVVDVTLDERKWNVAVSSDYYVIEQADINGIVIWQTTTGEIYRTDMNSKPRKVYDSLEEYILQI